MSDSLRFSEEIVLLSLDEGGARLPLPEKSLEFGVAGALLLELAFLGRVDTDASRLEKLDSSPTGDRILDRVLSMLPAGFVPIRDALASIARKGDSFVNARLNSLVEKGVLERREERFLWVVSERRYPVSDASRLVETRGRLRSIILSPGEIPSPSDAVLVALVSACGLMGTVLSDEEAKSSRSRIEAISKMDFIAQEISRSLAEIQRAIIEAIAYSGF